MLTGREDLLQALVEAYMMEKGTWEFYTQASEKTNMPEAKKTFQKLCGWEERHMDYIRSLYEAVMDSREMKSFEDFKNTTKAEMTEAGIPIADLESNIEKYTIKDQMGALTLAMETEGKAYNLYRRFHQDAEDSNARIVFKEMMEQEVRHVEYLKKFRVELIESY